MSLGIYMAVGLGVWLIWVFTHTRTREHVLNVFTKSKPTFALELTLYCLLYPISLTYDLYKYLVKRVPYSDL